MYDSTSSQKYGLITLVARISDVPAGFSGSGGGGGGGSSSSSSKQQTAAPEIQIREAFYGFTPLL